MPPWAEQELPGTDVQLPHTHTPISLLLQFPTLSDLKPPPSLYCLPLFCGAGTQGRLGRQVLAWSRGCCCSGHLPSCSLGASSCLIPATSLGCLTTRLPRGPGSRRNPTARGRPGLLSPSVASTLYCLQASHNREIRFHHLMGQRQVSEGTHGQETLLRPHCPAPRTGEQSWATVRGTPKSSTKHLPQAFQLEG